MAKEKEDKKGGYTVAIEFRDKEDFNKVYKPGDEFTSEDQERIKFLIEQGYIKQD